MKIATWNVERLKHRKSLDEIIKTCNNINADILILTENDEAITPDYNYCSHTDTPEPLKVDHYDSPITYKSSEHRVSIYTNYKIVRQHDTYDKFTSLCLELETEKGNLLVYGTIIGIIGNRDSSYEKDLIKQTEDFRRFTDEGYNICISGDYNCSFSDNYYFTNKGRDTICETFSDCNIELLTYDCPSCINHIAISKKFIGKSTPHICEWNEDKSLSDHKGISVQFD